MSSRARIILVALLLLIPVLTFWMWLLTLAIHSSWLCPRECWCDPEGEVLDCSHATLKEVPHVYHSPIPHLKLDHNNLRELGKEVLVSRNIIQIEYFSLKHCKISRIDKDAFKGVVFLLQLNLEHNLLTELKVGTFKNMTNITSLQLAYNRIENLEAGIFEDLISLSWLYLEHNLLNSLKSDVFIGLTNLSSLWLSNNRLSTLHTDVFMHLTKLNYLYLDENEELQIPSNSSFLNIETVENLFISKCNISRIMPTSFENASNLTVLDLGNNDLKTIDENILRVMPMLRELLLYGNPLECDCWLLEVWRWCQEHDIKVARNREVLRCEDPEQVRGMWWGVLGKAQCRNGNIMFDENYKAVAPVFVSTAHLEYTRIENYMTYVHPVIHIFLFLFGTIGNATVLFVIICNSEMHTVPNIYIMNLAVSDLLSLTMNTIVTYITAESESWQVGEVLCKMFAFFRHLSVGVCAYLISVMSIQRYQVISRPLHNRHQWTRRIVAIASVLGVWTICSLFAIPYTSAMYAGHFKCTVLYSWKYYQKVVLFELLVFCVLPLCGTVCMYCLTARHLRSTNIMPGEIHNQGNSRRSTARIVLSFSVVFVLSFLPYHILLTLVIWGKLPQLVGLFYMFTISTYLLIFNSCFNPVALCCSSKCYRRYFKHYFLKCCGKKSATTANTAHECGKE